MGGVICARDRFGEASLFPPRTASAERRKCLTNHILSDSGAISLCSGPRAAFTLCLAAGPSGPAGTARAALEDWGAAALTSPVMCYEWAAAGRDGWAQSAVLHLRRGAGERF